MIDAIVDEAPRQIVPLRPGRHLIVAPSQDGLDWHAYERRERGIWTCAPGSRTPEGALSIAVAATRELADISFLPDYPTSFERLDDLLGIYPNGNYLTIICPYTRESGNTWWAHVASCHQDYKPDQLCTVRYGSRELAVDHLLLSRPEVPGSGKLFTSLFGERMPGQMPRPRRHVVWVRFGITALEIDRVEADRCADIARRMAEGAAHSKRLTQEREQLKLAKKPGRGRPAEAPERDKEVVR